MDETPTIEEFHEQARELYGKIKVVLDDADTTLVMNVLITFVAQIAVFAETPDLPSGDAVKALSAAIARMKREYPFLQGHSDNHEKYKGH